MKDWKCAAHGSFEGTHPICPEMGCLSEKVEREFRTPVSVSQGKYNRFDRGLRKTADMMHIPNWKTARAGETGFAGRGQDAPLGTQVLWGNEVGKAPGFEGKSFASLSAQAAQPLTEVAQRMAPDVAAKDPYIVKNNGMRAAATTLGVTRQVLPPAELTRSLAEKK